MTAICCPNKNYYTCSPGHWVMISSWHRLCTTQTHTWHWYPCFPTPQMKSLQWEQKVGCFRYTAMNLWPLTLKKLIFMFLSLIMFTHMTNKIFIFSYSPALSSFTLFPSNGVILEPIIPLFVAYFLLWIRATKAKVE